MSESRRVADGHCFPPRGYFRCPSRISACYSSRVTFWAHHALRMGNISGFSETETRFFIPSTGARAGCRATPSRGWGLGRTRPAGDASPLALGHALPLFCLMERHPVPVVISLGRSACAAYRQFESPSTLRFWPCGLLSLGVKSDLKYDFPEVFQVGYLLLAALLIALRSGWREVIPIDSHAGAQDKVLMERICTAGTPDEVRAAGKDYEVLPNFGGNPRGGGVLALFGEQKSRLKCGIPRLPVRWFVGLPDTSAPPAHRPYSLARLTRATRPGFWPPRLRAWRVPGSPAGVCRPQHSRRGDTATGFQYT